MKDNKEEEKRIVVEHHKSFLKTDILTDVIWTGIGSGFLWLYFHNGNIPGLVIACIVLPIALGMGAWRVWKWFNKDIVIMDEEGLYWARKKRKYPWDKIQELICEIKDDGTESNSYDHNLRCVLKDGEELKANITGSNFSADMLCKEIKEIFPKIKCNLKE